MIAGRASQPTLIRSLHLPSCKKIGRAAFQLLPGKERNALLRRARLMNGEDEIRVLLASLASQAPR
jgi:hypothetical protein